MDIITERTIITSDNFSAMPTSHFTLYPPQTTSLATLAYKAWARHSPCHQEAQHRDQAGAEPQQVKEPRVRALRGEQGRDADGGGRRHDQQHDGDQRKGGLVRVQLSERGAERDEKAFALERT